MLQYLRNYAIVEKMATVRHKYFNASKQAKEDLDSLFMKSYKGYTDQLRLANMLSACTKRINEFSKICKNKTLEIDLVMHVLEAIFSETTNLFGTCFTTFDYKVGVMVKRAITLIETKIHPDYKIEYSSKINSYLNVLHRTANHIDAIYGMPEAI